MKVQISPSLRSKKKKKRLIETDRKHVLIFDHFIKNGCFPKFKIFFGDFNFKKSYLLIYCNKRWHLINCKRNNNNFERKKEKKFNLQIVCKIFVLKFEGSKLFYSQNKVFF